MLNKAPKGSPPPVETTQLRKLQADVEKLTAENTGKGRSQGVDCVQYHHALLILLRPQRDCKILPHLHLLLIFYSRKNYTSPQDLVKVNKNLNLELVVLRLNEQSGRRIGEPKPKPVSDGLRPETDGHRTSAVRVNGI